MVSSSHKSLSSLVTLHMHHMLVVVSSHLLPVNLSQPLQAFTYTKPLLPTAASYICLLPSTSLSDCHHAVGTCRCSNIRSWKDSDRWFAAADALKLSAEQKQNFMAYRVTCLDRLNEYVHSPLSSPTCSLCLPFMHRLFSNYTPLLIPPVLPAALSWCLSMQHPWCVQHPQLVKYP